MSKKPKYLQHYLEKRCDESLYSDKLITDQIADLIVVIPCYKEDWATILPTLESLEKADSRGLFTKVFLLINYKENDNADVKAKAQLLFSQLMTYALNHSETYVWSKELSGKHKGVGLARKLLMDTAFLYFNHYGQNGLIVNLDADTIVDLNYYQSINSSFKTDKSMEAASIDFHHTSLESNAAILNYEFHLNYFIQMQRWVGLPFAYQTIGSAMAVRAYAYAKQGGMNLRQAGEDFYFLHKYTKTQTLRDITKTTVRPSGRESDRVPFGTGKAVADFNNNNQTNGVTYNPRSFVILKRWLQKVVKALEVAEDFVSSDNSVLDSYLECINAKTNYHKILVSSNDPAKRTRHFFTWFDAFLFFKYLHYCRDNGLDDVPNQEAGVALCMLMGWSASTNLYENLILLREKGRIEDYHTQWRAGLMTRPSRTSAS